MKDPMSLRQEQILGSTSSDERAGMAMDPGRTSRVPPNEGERYESGDFLPAPEASYDLWGKFTAWETPDPSGGDLWRLQWDTVVALAVVEPKSDGWTFSALPVSEDPQFATDTDLILESEESPLGMPTMVQVALEMVLHRRVLDRYLGQVTDLAWKDLRQLRTAFVHSEPSDLPLGRVGPAVTHELDERLQYRSEQREACMSLAFAEWYRRPSGQTASDLLRERIQELNLSLEDWAQHSSVSVQKLVRLLREEKVSLSEEELKGLASTLEFDAMELKALFAPRFPVELVEALDSPSQKRRIHTWAEEWESDEGETRLRMAAAVFGLARRAKRMTSSDWSQLLEKQYPT